MSMALSDLSIPISASIDQLDKDLALAEKRVQAAEQRIAQSQSQSEQSKTDNVVKAEKAKTDAVQKRALTEQELQRKTLKESGRVFEDIQKITKLYAVAAAALGAVTAATEGWGVAMALVSGDADKIDKTMKSLSESVGRIPVVGQAYQAGEGLGNLQNELIAGARKKGTGARVALGIASPITGLLDLINGEEISAVADERERQARSAGEQERRLRNALRRQALGESAGATISDVNQEAYLQGLPESERAEKRIGLESHKKIAEMQKQEALALSLKDTELAKKLADAQITEAARAQREIRALRDKAAAEQADRAREANDARRGREQEEADERERMAFAHAQKIAKIEADVRQIELTRTGDRIAAERDAINAEADAQRRELENKAANSWSEIETKQIEEEIEALEKLRKAKLEAVVDTENKLPVMEIGKQSVSVEQFSKSRSASGGQQKNPLEAIGGRTNDLLADIRSIIRGGARAA